ncbi:MAG: hypothetical protein LUH21_26725 [Clostridiales bacterium]|nr:hypothetical protein [Clostridiales bacterium]
MQTYRKKDMLQMTEVWIKANDIVSKNIKSKLPEVMTVLVQCRQSAVSLGAYIETLEGNYGDLVRELEDYCESLGQMSKEASEEKKFKQLSEKVRIQLLRLYNKLDSDIPADRREVVFLPYKASMWDSLESVWKAADEDENTDAYVIPVPYYDRNPDGSIREEHYEGDLYPDYVPVTHYNEYNFKERRPELVFIHNPYDGDNYITTVHPFFYSKNLKQFTKRLVYIPYFILDDIKSDGAGEEIGYAKQFCLTPGVINADKVIVQSENMRRLYIKVLTEAMGNSEKVRAYWEEKISGLGSPKLDKAARTRKEELRIPDKWLEIIQKPDGSWKKIVLYNTSIAALLEHGEKILKKMEEVFAFFEERKEKTALLWRPHPLLESTLISMRPKLWEQYRVIRDNYICHGWGIYDNTAELERAVAISDAYYGDASSVAQLYKVSGKPIMLQDADTIEQEGAGCSV